MTKFEYYFCHLEFFPENSYISKFLSKFYCEGVDCIQNKQDKISRNLCMYVFFIKQTVSLKSNKPQTEVNIVVISISVYKVLLIFGQMSNSFSVKRWWFQINKFGNIFIGIFFVKFEINPSIRHSMRTVITYVFWKEIDYIPNR